MQRSVCNGYYFYKSNDNNKNPIYMCIYMLNMFIRTEIVEDMCQVYRTRCGKSRIQEWEGGEGKVEHNGMTK